MTAILDRLRGPGTHRAVDEVERLNEVNERLRGHLATAGDHIGYLERTLAETNAHRAEAEQVVVCLDADLVERTEERDQALATVAALEARLAPYLAADANAAAVTVPEMVRDTSAVEDQATTPIKVTTLWQRFGVGPVIAVPGSTDPAVPPA